MAVVWTHIASAASRPCEPTKPCTDALPLKEETKLGTNRPARSGDELVDAATGDERELFGALLTNRLQLERSKLQEQVDQLQSVLEETRYMLTHEQRLVEELKAQLQDEKTRRQRQQRSVQDQLDMQCMEIKQLHEELESAQVALHQKIEASRELQNTKKSENMKLDVCKARESEAELLTALLEHARIQASARETSAREEGKTLQELRTELELAQRKASEEQKAAEELRVKLHHEEATRHQLQKFNELQMSFYMREARHHRAFRADVAEFLQELGQRYLGIAKEVASASGDPLTLYGAGGG